MINIITSKNCKNEKEYIVSSFFKDFLEIDFKISFDDDISRGYHIKYLEKSIIINDHFFKNHLSNDYLNIKNIPKSISYFDQFDKIKTPIIYGENKLKINENNIIVGLDIFASSFFMLTRWEEYVIKKRDIHGRFPTQLSLAFKNNFHRKPIVNEYIELLKKLLITIGFPKSKFKVREFNYQFSHDVDHPLLFPNFSSFIKQSAYQLLKKQNLKQSIKFINNYFSSNKDPYDSFDLLMELSEKHNSKSQFNLMNSTKGEFDEGYNLNSVFNKKLINKIKDRGHIIGFHPSYNSFNNVDLWISEREGLEKIANQNITKGRQHYLRFENPKTFNIWEKNNMTEDSSIGYHDEVGFRAGICYPFHIFDFLNRKKINLTENPLILMEGALINCLNVNSNDFIQISRNLKEEVKKHSGNYTILWHNSSFFIDRYPLFKDVLINQL